MPKVVDLMPDPEPRQNGGSKYEEYLDGRVFFFAKKELPEKGVKAMRVALYRLAKAKGLKVTVREAEKGTYVQATPKEKE